MSGVSPLFERFGARRGALSGLGAVLSFALASYTSVFASNAYATTNELDNDYFSFVIGELSGRGFPCSSGDMGHILYEDDLVAILEIVCESSESYEIIDIYNMEDIIIQSKEKTTE